MPPNTTTIGDFLDARGASDVEELHHAVVGRPHSEGINSHRYEDLGYIELWHEFNRNTVSASVVTRPFLTISFECPWKSWVPQLSRIIYSERQLETLYAQTLITRVNIALEKALLPQEQRITIVNCPGAFGSHQSVDNSFTTIFPDWVVVQGDYSFTDDGFPKLHDLVSNRQILAVGDTKLARRANSDDRSGNIAPGSISCQHEYLAQLQQYSRMLYTRFAFILSNEELVVAQFLQEKDASPRSPRRRGLRSSTGADQLYGELASDFASSESSNPTHHGDDNDSEEIVNNDTEGEETSLLTPSKRKYEQSPQTSSSPDRTRPVPTEPSEHIEQDIPSTPTGPIRQDHVSGPSTPLAAAPSLAPSSPFGEDEIVPPSSVPPSSVPPSSTTYTPTERDHDIERVLIRSFQIPNHVQSEECNEDMHPAKALFTLLMLARAVGPVGRKIGVEAVGFE